MRSIPCIEKNAFKNFSVGLDVTAFFVRFFKTQGEKKTQSLGKTQGNFGAKT